MQEGGWFEQFPDDEQHQQNGSEQANMADEHRAEPAELFTLIEHDLQSDESRPEEEQADKIEFRRAGGWYVGGQGYLNWTLL